LKPKGPTGSKEMQPGGVKFGDENTSLFQTLATYSMRRNFISSLTLQDGPVILDLEQKARALWLAFKERLGVSEFLGILYELSELIQASDLPVLDDPFSLDEITVALKDMPSASINH
jgi:hypothetical protein